MPLAHPDDLEAIDSKYYQNLHLLDEDISEFGLTFSDDLRCSICGKVENFDLKSNTNDQCDVNENNKVSIKI